MFKVLLVDDERMILKGISSIVEWEEQGTVLHGTARNGLEALDFIEKNDPDIVITDITMPGLDGMGLIEQGRKISPLIKWILLSGYNEFEYAQKAMRFGVKHYLLKPTSEEAIHEALEEVVHELVEEKEENLYLKNIESKMTNAINEEKELFFKEVLTNGSLPEEKFHSFLKKHLGISEGASEFQVRMVLFHIESNDSSTNLQEIKKTVEVNLSENCLCSTILERTIILLLKEKGVQEGDFKNIKAIQSSIKELHGRMATIFISNCFFVVNIHDHYHKGVQGLEEKFYQGAGTLITEPGRFPTTQNDDKFYEYDLERLIIQLKAGRKEEALKELNCSIDKVSEKRLRVALAKSYFIQLYLAILKVTSPSFVKKQMKEIDKLERIDTLSSFRSLLVEAIQDRDQMRASSKKTNYSAVVNKMMDVINDNIENPDMSLQWVANEVLYMNTDYLGKLFKKEVGEKFSAYVLRRKIDKAVEIIEKQKDIRVFEVAEKLGYGNNPQYFSHIFKKRTGCTPTDLIKNS